MIQATLPRRTAAPTDLSKLDLNTLAQQALQPWADAYDNWRASLDGWNTGVADQMKPSRTVASACGCPTCAPDPCTCRCCVNDADLVIETRVGERRVVPVVIENRWRRARDIEIELSSWTKISDTVAIKAEILGEMTFSLAPCGRAEVVLLINVAQQAAPNTGDQGQTPKVANAQAGKAPAANQAANQAAATRTPVQLPDVDRCEVAYADLRIKGCDLRSIRVAVAVLPRDCEAYTVDCDCGCCC